MKFAPSHRSFLLRRFVFHKVEACDWWWAARNHGKDTLPLPLPLSRLWIRGRSHRLSLVFYSHSWPKNFWVLNGWWNFLKVRFSLNSSESRAQGVCSPTLYPSFSAGGREDWVFPRSTTARTLGPQKLDAWLFLPLRVNLKVVFAGGKIFCTLWSFKLMISLLSFSVWTL